MNLEQIANFINGGYKPPLEHHYLENFNPATGEIYSLVPDSTQADVDLAVQAAEAAFPAWSRLPLEERFDVLLRIAKGIEKRLEKLALAESIDSGKPLQLAREMDIPRAVSNFRFFAAAALEFFSESHAAPGNILNYTLRQPIGTVACISPWNLPLYLFTWKIAPALAAGNCVVAKPSEMTPMTAFLLGEICQEAGLPAGVLNIIQGSGLHTGTAMVRHKGIKAISFTGGTKTGEAIAREAAPKFKKLSLELGGKNPVIIFDDCRYEDMLRTTLRSSFRNQGQICLCGSRILVQDTLYERFRHDFVQATRELRVGDPLEEGSNLGAVISKAHMDKILSYIQLAEEEGGRILCGGFQVVPEGRCSKGWFVSPTVVEGLTEHCRTNQEEIFGPVVTLMPFSTEEEALHLANSTRYGLASVLWTENLSRAHRMAAGLQSGIVWINTWLQRDLRTPFGGVKDSGVGREGGFDAMRFFTEPKNVCIAY